MRRKKKRKGDTRVILWPYRCHICKRNIRKRKSLDKHLKAYHMEGHVYKCPDCNKQFKARKPFAEHIAGDCSSSNKDHQHMDHATASTSMDTNTANQPTLTKATDPGEGTSKGTIQAVPESAEPPKEVPVNKAADSDKNGNKETCPANAKTPTKSTPLKNDVVGPLLAIQQSPPIRFTTRPAQKDHTPRPRKNASDPRCSTTKINRGPNGQLRRVSFPGVDPGESLMVSRQPTKPAAPRAPISRRAKRPFQYDFSDTFREHKRLAHKAAASSSKEPDVTEKARSEANNTPPPAKKLKDTNQKDNTKPKGSQKDHRKGPQIPPDDLFIPGKSSTAPKIIPLDRSTVDEDLTLDNISQASSSMSDLANILEEKITSDKEDLHEQLHLSESSEDESTTKTQTDDEPTLPQKWLDTITLMNTCLSKLTEVKAEDIDQNKMSTLLDVASLLINTTD